MKLRATKYRVTKYLAVVALFSGAALAQQSQVAALNVARLFIFGGHCRARSAGDSG